MNVPTVRKQAALVRALLDELERVAPLNGVDALTEQLIEEIARLGCRCVRFASALTEIRDAQERPSDPAHGVARCA
jgi:hypothetical protein